MSKQCHACPWKKGTKPKTDIPGGYCEKKHAALKETIAEPHAFQFSGIIRMMACHESPVGREHPCVGWAANQLGPGNNLALRLLAIHRKCFDRLETVGPQHECLEDTLP